MFYINSDTLDPFGPGLLLNIRPAWGWSLTHFWNFSRRNKNLKHWRTNFQGHIVCETVHCMWKPVSRSSMQAFQGYNVTSCSQGQLEVFLRPRIRLDSASILRCMRVPRVGLTRAPCSFSTDFRRLVIAAPGGGSGIGAYFRRAADARFFFHAEDFSSSLESGTPCPLPGALATCTKRSSTSRLIDCA
jgi:hypothetical protein